MTGLVPHICGHKNEMILNDLSLDAQPSNVEHGKVLNLHPL